MSTIPKSAELRALANIFGIDYSHINFRSAPQRRALYDQIKIAKAEQVTPTESEANAELEQLRIENARLRLENQELKDQLNNIDKRLAKLEGELTVREHVGKSLEAQLSEYRKTQKVVEKSYVQDLIDRMNKQIDRSKETTNEINEIIREINE